MNYEQAVAREEENRRIAHLSRGRPLLGCPMTSLRWRHCLELTTLQNAFFTLTPAQAGDVYEFLWRLHPWFLTEDGRLPNLPPGAARPCRWRVLLQRWRVARAVRVLNLALAEHIILAWIDEHYQDKPSADAAAEGSTSSLAPRLTWFDYLAAKYERYGYTPEQIQELGVAYTFQMERADLIMRGDGIRCIPPSAALKSFED